MKNAKTLPSVYYGMHFESGVCEYRETGKVDRVFINESTAKQMDPTFTGKPIYVHHVPEVDLHNIQTEADGYVIESFFNQADGKHWVKFIVVSDKGHEAIKIKKWKLSNAYTAKQFSSGGEWHAVPYSKEIVKGEYDHLAIVPDPRYEDSIIMTPEQFKQYNLDKENELLRLANDKGESMSVFKLFNRKEADNQKELLAMSVKLPISGKEDTVESFLKTADTYLNEVGMPEHMANGEHMVMVGDEKMKVNDLAAKHMAMCNDLAALKAKHETKEENAESEGGGEDTAMENDVSDVDDDAKKKLKMENDAKEAKELEEKKQNEKAAADKKAKEKENYDKLMNAKAKAESDGQVIEVCVDGVARGKSKFGSN